MSREEFIELCEGLTEKIIVKDKYFVSAEAFIIRKDDKKIADVRYCASNCVSDNGEVKHIIDLKKFLLDKFDDYHDRGIEVLDCSAFIELQKIY